MDSEATGISRGGVEEKTRLWLESSYLQAMARLAEGREPSWDASGRPLRVSPYSFQEIQRKLKIFRWLERLDFESFIDVGSGFDVYPNLVRRRYGARAYFSDFAHSMNLPYGGAPSGKLDHAVTMNAARLPFADDTFDVVMASEVLEHLVRPIEVISELVRVSRKYVLMTSLEALSVSRFERWRQHLKVDVTKPHVERNFFLLDEFDAIFAPRWYHENLFFDANLPAGSFESAERQAAAYGALTDAPALEAALCRAVAIGDHRPGALGILLVKAKGDAPVALHDPASDAAVAGWLMEQTAEFERFGFGLLAAMREGRAELADRDRPIASDLLALLRCPDCRSTVERAGSGVRCARCGVDFPGEYGVPMVYPKRMAEGEAAAEESLAILCGDDARRRRVLRGLMRRLRRNEGPPGEIRRLLWRLGV